MRGVLIACLVVAVGCTTAGPARTIASPSPTADRWAADPQHTFGVAGRTVGADHCASSEQVEEVLHEFTTAFNSGRTDAVAQVLSSALWAVSLNVGGKAEAAYGREDAVRYLGERQRAGDHLRFIRVKVNDLAGWDGAAQFGPVDFTLERGGSAIATTGKGALYCGGAARGIEVLGLGDGTPAAPR